VPDRVRVTSIGSVSALALLLAACAVKPEPFTEQQTLDRAVEDRGSLTADQAAIDGPISIYEAVARALLYNLDQRQALMEQALQNRQLDLARFDMLPRLAASAGYTTRSNQNASSSESIFTGRESLEPSTSQDRNRAIADLSFSWNLLDFGVSYYQARQQADRVLIAEQRRRRVINNLVQEVRGAFWQAATAERLITKIDPLLEEGVAALQRARMIERERLRSPVETLRFQKSMLEILRQLRGLRADLQQAKARLASLMNIEPNTDYELATPELDNWKVPDLGAQLGELELLALINRPELREEDYQKRIGHHEVRTAMLRMLPGISFESSANFDSNSFLVHNTWAQATGQVTWNLIGLLQGPTAIKAAEAQVDVAESRRMALSMAVITQVNLAYRRFQRSVVDYRNASQLEEIEQRIFTLVKQAEAGAAESDLERIRSSAAAIAAELARDQAFAEVQSALGNIYASLGVDPLPAEIEDRSLDAVTAAVADVARRWERGRFPELPEGAPEPERFYQDPAPSLDEDEDGGDIDTDPGAPAGERRQTAESRAPWAIFMSLFQ
jgi:outer membrane protein TolC